MTPPRPGMGRRGWLWGALLLILLLLNLREHLGSATSADTQVVNARAPQAARPGPGPRTASAADVAPSPERSIASAASATSEAIQAAADKASDAAPTSTSFKEIFAVRSWQPPPPKVEPAPPPPPTAPPLPFSFLGKKQQDGHWEVYLGTGGGFVVARQGEKLLDTYRVLRIEPPRLTLRYLPLQQEQSLDIGE